jgi:hypothetical protein
VCKIGQTIEQRKSNPVPFQNGAGDSERAGRMTKRPKVELVPVEADSDTQRVLERLIVALEKQGFKIIRKEQK